MAIVRMQVIRILAAAATVTCSAGVHADAPGTERPFPVAGAKFEHDASVTLSDGLDMKINVYRPAAPGRYPVIVTHGIYGKDVVWQTAAPYQAAWAKMNQRIPTLCKASTCQFMRWEMPDPERWVPEGYVVVQADSRGAGKTGGFLDPLGAREVQDYKELIEWAAAQPWSNGKVGLLGISYYAIGQWQVAALQPKGLAAIIPWEGAVDSYRDMTHHGGIPATTFTKLWYASQILPNQHGNGASAFRDAITGDQAAVTPLPQALLAGNRAPLEHGALAHTLDDEYHRQRTPDLGRVTVPVLSVGNWGGMGLHLRGNVEGYLGAASAQKWLRVHSGDHTAPFYEEESLALQMRFFERFLKGNERAFQEPPIKLMLRHPGKPDAWRAETQWPLAGTQFQRWYLSAADRALVSAALAQAGEVSYEVGPEGATFLMPPSAEDREFTGPVKARLRTLAHGTDADFFLTLRLLDPAGKDVTFEGAAAPAVPVSNGWLRLSQRGLDGARSTPSRPLQSHRNPLPATPGEIYDLDIEIWPTSIVVPAGYTLALTVAGGDFAFPHLKEGPYRGSFPFLHAAHPPATSGGKHTLLTGGEQGSYLQLPLIPAGRR
ncbi:CocE/NonD family hydrolase [Acidovorax sp. Q11]